MQLPSLQPNPWPMGPSLIDSSAAVHSNIVCCKQLIKLFGQHPDFAQCISRASGYRRPCNSRDWSASPVGPLPSFFRAGHRLYRGWTVHQCWCSTSTFDSWLVFIFDISHLFWDAYPAFGLHPSSFLPKRAKSVFSLLFLFVWTDP